MTLRPPPSRRAAVLDRWAYVGLGAGLLVLSHYAAVRGSETALQGEAVWWAVASVVFGVAGAMFLVLAAIGKGES